MIPPRVMIPPPPSSDYPPPPREIHSPQFPTQLVPTPPPPPQLFYMPHWGSMWTPVENHWSRLTYRLHLAPSPRLQYPGSAPARPLAYIKMTTPHKAEEEEAMSNHININIWLLGWAEHAPPTPPPRVPTWSSVTCVWSRLGIYRPANI